MEAAVARGTYSRPRRPLRSGLGLSRPKWNARTNRHPCIQPADFQAQDFGRQRNKPHLLPAAGCRLLHLKFIEAVRSQTTNQNTDDDNDDNDDDNDDGDDDNNEVLSTTAVASRRRLASRRNSFRLTLLQHTHCIPIQPGPSSIAPPTSAS
jgi:hypothetical protein